MYGDEGDGDLDLGSVVGLICLAWSLTVLVCEEPVAPFLDLINPCRNEQMPQNFGGLRLLYFNINEVSNVVVVDLLGIVKWSIALWKLAPSKTSVLRPSVSNQQDRAEFGCPGRA